MPTLAAETLFVLAAVGLPVAVLLGALLVLGGAAVRRLGAMRPKVSGKLELTES